MGFSGRLEGIGLCDIFQIISQNRMTGTLIARCTDGTAMVVFQDGQVVEAASDAPEESLGHILSSQGLVAPAAIEAARERWKQRPDVPFGAVLVEMGAIAEKALDVQVRRQIAAIVDRLMSCDDGFITFDRGEGAVRRKLNTREFLLTSGVSPEFLIMERARVADEDRRSGRDRRGLAPAREQTGTPERGRRATDAEVPELIDPVPLASPPRRSLPAWLGSVWNALCSFSPDGRALIIAGVLAALAGLALIAASSFTTRTTEDNLRVIDQNAVLRARPAAKADTVAQVALNDIVAPITVREGWYQVRTAAGEMGWIWKDVVEQHQVRGRVFAYRATGFELLVIAGALLLVFGVLRKRKAGSATG